MVGGNRSGKSKVGEGIVSRLVRREGPVYERLTKPEGRPLKVWVVPQTDEKALSVWEPRLKEMFGGMEFTYVASPHRVFTWRDPQGGGTLWLKSQEQGLKAFESDEVDLILFDEEPEDRRIVTSAKTRFATTNGVLVFTYTPLLGMTWTYDELYAPAAKGENVIGDRAWRLGDAVTVVQMGMADNPAAAAGVERIQSDPSITDAEKAARLYGVYGFTEGLIWPQLATLKQDTPSPYVIREADFRRKVMKDHRLRWFLLSDPNKQHAALLMAYDHLENRYVVAEHFAVGLSDTMHGDAYRELLARYRVSEDELEAYADPGGAGKQAMLNLAETGFYATPVPKDAGSVSASIKRVRRALHIDPAHAHPITGQLGAPRLYFLDSLTTVWQEGGSRYEESRLMWELRQYRQKQSRSGEPVAPDTPIKKNDDCVDCLRYFELAHAAEPGAPKGFTPDELAKAKLDSLSRHEQDSYDALIEKIERHNRTWQLAR